MEHIYPAIFSANNDGSYTIVFPDLPGCISEGKNLSNAMHMAQDALSQWISYLQDSSMPIPPSSNLGVIKASESEFPTLICADVRDTRAVKRTVSLPNWMDARAAEAGLSLSRVLQDALSQRLQ